MQTLTITRYSQLSDRQWRRVAKTAKRQVRQITGTTCEIGIGRKYQNREPSGSQVVIRVYLPHKKRRVAKSRQVPKRFSIRLQRADGGFDQLSIGSDVETLGDYVPTAATVRSGRRTASSGFLLRWIDDHSNVHWGFATVGHLFDDRSVRSASVRVDGTTRLDCRYLAAPAKRLQLDLVVLEINGTSNDIVQRLTRSGTIDSDDPAEISVISARRVHRLAMEHRRGHTHAPDAEYSFVGEEVFPNGFLLGSRRLDDCIRVGRAARDAFREGTSGSCWCFGDDPACMQVGGKATDFREGIGQPFDRHLDWIRSAIHDTAKIVAVLT